MYSRTGEPAGTSAGSSRCERIEAFLSALPRQPGLQRVSYAAQTQDARRLSGGGPAELDRALRNGDMEEAAVELQRREREQHRKQRRKRVRRQPLEQLRQRA